MKKHLYSRSKKHGKVVTIEDGVLRGGLASNILELMNQHSFKEVSFIGFGYPDEFVKHGTIEQIEEKYGLTEKQMAEKIQKEIFQKEKNLFRSNKRKQRKTRKRGGKRKWQF